MHECVADVQLHDTTRTRAEGNNEIERERLQWLQLVCMLLDWKPVCLFYTLRVSDGSNTVTRTGTAMCRPWGTVSAPEHDFSCIALGSLLSSLLTHISKSPQCMITQCFYSIALLAHNIINRHSSRDDNWHQNPATRHWTTHAYRFMHLDSSV